MERSDWGNEWEHVKDVVRSLEAWVSAFERQLQSMQEQLKKWDERFDMIKERVELWGKVHDLHVQHIAGDEIERRFADLNERINGLYTHILHPYSSELKWTSRIKKMGENADKIQTMAVDREQEATEESPLERRVRNLEGWRDVWGSKAEGYQYDVPALKNQQETIFRRLDEIDDWKKHHKVWWEGQFKLLIETWKAALDERIEIVGHEVVRVKQDLFELRNKVLGQCREKEFFIRIRRQQSGQPALFVDLTAGNGRSVIGDECFRNKEREEGDMVILGPFRVQCDP